MFTVGTIRGVFELEDKFSEVFDAFGTKLQSSAGAWKSAGAGMMAAGGVFTAAFTVPIVGGIALVSKAAIDFESAFANVKKTMGEGADFAKINAEIREMAKTSTSTAVELANIAALGAQFGVSDAGIMQFTQTISDLSLAIDGMSPEAAAESLAQIGNVLKVPESQFRTMADTLVDLGNKGASSEAMILEFTQRLSVAGKALELPTHAVMGFGAAMANVGLNAEAGGSALSKTFYQIDKAVATGSKDLGVFAEIAGQSAAEFSAAFAEKPEAAIQSFLLGLKDINDAGGNMGIALDALGIKETRQIAALGALAMSGEKLTKTMNDSANAWATGGALQEEASKKAATLANQWQMMKNRLNDVAITLGNSLMPTLKRLMELAEPVLQWAVKAAEWFTKLPEPVRTFALVLAGVTAAIGPLLIAAGGLVSTIAILAANTAVIAVFTAIGTAIGAAIVPILAITAAVGIAWAIWNTWGDVIKNWVSGAYASLVSALQTAKEWVTNVATSVYAVIKPFVDAGASVLTFVANLAKFVILGTIVGGFELLKTIVGEVWRIVQVTYADFARFGSWLGGVLSPIINAVVGVFKTFWDSLSGAVSGVLTWAYEKLTQLANSVKWLFDKLNEMIPKFQLWGGAAEDAAKRTEDVHIPVEDFTMSLVAFGPPAELAGKAAKRVGIGMSGIGEPTNEATKALKAFNTELAKFSGKTAVEDGKKTEAMLIAIGGATKVLPSQLQAMSDTFKEAAAGARALGDQKLAEHFDALAKSTDPAQAFASKYGVTLRDIVPIVTDFNALIVEQNSLMEKQPEAFNLGVIAVKSFFKVLDDPTTWVGFKASVQSAITPEDLSPWLRAVKGAKEGIVQVLSSIPATLASAFEGGGGLVGALKSIGIQLATSIAKPMFDALSKVQQQTVSMGGAMATALGGAVGGGTGAQIAGIASSLGGAALAASAWGTSMAAAGAMGTVALGAATLGIGAAAVGVYFLAKKFLTVSKEVKEARKNLLSFQEALNKTLTATQLKGTTEQWQRDLVAVRDAYLSVGMTAAQAENVVSRMWNTDKPAESKKAMEEISAVMKQIAEETEIAVKFQEKMHGEMAKIGQEGGLASENLVKFRDAMRGDKTIEDFIKQQTRSAADHVKTFLDNAKISTQAGASAMSGVILAAWDGTAAGLRDMMPHIQTLQKSLEAAGFQGGAAFGVLQHMAAIASHEVMGPMLTAINAATGAMSGMFNAGLLTEDMFDGLTGEVMNLRQKMIDQGQSSAMVNRMMQKDLQQIWTLQKMHGMTVDENTQKVLTEAEAQGQVGEKFLASTDKMALSMERIVQLLEKAFGEDVPNAVDATNDAIDKIPRNVRVDVDVNYNDPGLVHTQPVPNGDGFQSVTDGANRAADAVDGLNFGTSPGGIIAIPELLHEASLSAKAFQSEFMASFAAVKAMVDSVSMKDWLVISEEGDPLQPILDSISKIPKNVKIDVEVRYDDPGFHHTMPVPFEGRVGTPAVTAGASINAVDYSARASASPMATGAPQVTNSQQFGVIIQQPGETIDQAVERMWQSFDHGLSTDRGGSRTVLKDFVRDTVTSYGS